MCRNNSHRGERSQIAGCAMLGAGRQGVVPLTRPVREMRTVHSPALSGLACTAAGVSATPLCTLQVEEFMRYEDDLTDNLMHVANYIIDCHDPGDWATSVTVR